MGAHRGGAKHRPENTLAAFREAVRLGAHMVELDLRRTADGAIVVMHDAEVGRTTDGRGEVAKLGLEELRRLDAGARFASDWAGERIPTLDEALDVVPRSAWVNLQIKHGEPIAAEVTRTLVRRDRLDHCFLACGNAAAREARATHPDVLICNLVRQPTRDAYLEHCIRTGSNFIQFHFLRGIPTAEEIGRAREAGLRVNHFCHPDGSDVLELLEVGVDFPLVDDVPAGLAAARRVRIEPAQHPDGV